MDEIQMEFVSGYSERRSCRRWIWSFTWFDSDAYLQCAIQVSDWSDLRLTTGTWICWPNWHGTLQNIKLISSDQISSAVLVLELRTAGRLMTTCVIGHRFLEDAFMIQSEILRLKTDSSRTVSAGSLLPITQMKWRRSSVCTEVRWRHLHTIDQR